MLAPETLAVQTQDVEMLAVAMNAHVLQDALVIHIKDACVVNRPQFVQITHADEMQHAELLTKMKQNAIVHRFIQTEIHTMNVSFGICFRIELKWKYYAFSFSIQVHNLETLPIVDNMDALLVNVFVKALNIFVNKVCSSHFIFYSPNCLNVWFVSAIMMMYIICCCLQI